jgi:hypothetical protein
MKLYEFAKDYKIKNNKIVYANTSLSLKQHDGIKFISSTNNLKIALCISNNSK